MRILLSICLGLSLLAQPAFAQEADDRRALAERLIQVSQGSKMIQQIETAVRQELVGLTEMPDDQAEWMRANAPRMVTRMVETLLRDLTTTYADLYTEAELRAQIAFFETPEGRSTAEKSVTLGLRQSEAIQQAQMTYLTELMGKFCAEFACEPDAAGIGKRP